MIKINKWFRLIVCAYLLTGAAIVSSSIFFRTAFEQSFQRASITFEEGHYQTTRVILEKLLREQPADQRVHLFLAQTLLRLHLHDLARQRAQTSLMAGDANTAPEIQAGLNKVLGEAAFRLGQLREAEEAFKRVLELNPNLVSANKSMVHLLQVQARSWETLPYLKNLVRQGTFIADELLMVGMIGDLHVSDPQLLGKALKNSPDDVTIQFGDAQQLWMNNKRQAAYELARRIVTVQPKHSAAQSLIGKALLAEHRFEELAMWFQNLPPSVLDYPEIWFVRGTWALEYGDETGATRCFLEVLARFPEHPEASYLLSQTFAKLKEEELSARFRDQAGSLAKVGFLLKDLQNAPNSDLIDQLSLELEKLGRHLEAFAWCSLLTRFDKVEWAEERMNRLLPMVLSSTDFTSEAHSPLRGIQVDSYSLPVPTIHPYSKKENEKLASTKIRFEDVAEELNLDFHYFNSMNAEVGLEHIFQTTGGGVAALDYDQDGRTDLYLGNGTVLPESSSTVNQLDDPQYHDVLFRNLGVSGFEELSHQASIVDLSYSQGVTAGDVNNDGFQDVYVCNIGQNRLFINNGDGTFSEESQTCAGNEWSMSCAIADLNHDSIPDIYAVNYLKMDEVFAKSCKKDGEPLTCAPTMFHAEQDRLYIGSGSGSFSDVTVGSGLETNNGKGLGIVVADFFAKGELDVFIANDTTANHFFENRSSPRHPMFTENAILSGLAFNFDGQAQACMGTAAGDINSDGLMDLYVTNFFADSNTLYLAQTDGFFGDTTRHTDFRNTTYGMLGFGTQFLDADRDGDLDIAVTNGHVDQSFATGEPDRMPGQFFIHQSDGSFATPDSPVSDYFLEKHFGRAMCCLDWNNDALPCLTCVLFISILILLCCRMRLSIQEIG